MAYISTDGVQRYQFEIFQNYPIVHGIFSRQGGVSPQPWSSLNLGGTVGDVRENVIENRKRIFDSIKRKIETHYDAWQVHGIHVIRAVTPRNGAPHVPGDAIITNNPAITLLMRFADCVPILLYDPDHHAIGIVHAGWQGTVKRTVQYALRSMQDNFQTKPASIIAGIGPSIGPDHYEVGIDVVEQVGHVFPKNYDILKKNPVEQYYLDLWKANQYLLEEMGVKKIQVAEICTACHTDMWYSHRAEKGKTGRFGAIIALEKD